MTGRQLALEGSREHGDYQCPAGSGSHAENASAYLMSLSSAPPARREERRRATCNHGVCATWASGPQGAQSFEGRGCFAPAWLQGGSGVNEDPRISNFSSGAASGC